MNASARPSGILSPGLIQSLLLLATILILEWLPISLNVATGRGGGEMARAAVPFLALFFGFSYFRAGDTIQHISAMVKRVAVSWRFLALHVGAMLVFLALSVASPRYHLSGLGAVLLAAAWFASAMVGVAAAGCTFLRPRFWVDFLRATGAVALYSAGAAAVIWKLIPYLRSFWNNPHWRPVTQLTFRMVEVLLHPFVNVVSYPQWLIIGTPRFNVRVADSCSGLEGAGLMLVFSLVWLWLFRHDYRFPRALLLIPAGIGVMFLLNAVRIWALILIGNAGAPDVAIGGFHSQAGWIAFNLMVLGFALVVPRISWIRKSGAPSPVRADASPANPTIPYLLPFAAILAAAFLSRAVSAKFEWFYGLRFFAAATALWFCRARYRQLNWSLHWMSPVAGAAVFVFWLALAGRASTASPIAAGLASLPVVARVAWLLFRIAAAVGTVPMAEELAFRGFLLRRLVSPEFEAISLRTFTWVALAGSSLAFGLLHGQLWLAGTLAGALYACVMLRRGSIGDAVVAHATTNALLAVWVLTTGRFDLW